MGDILLPERSKIPAAIRRFKLKFPELSQSEIARQVGCSRQNVNQVLHKFLDGASEDELRQFQDSRADIYDAVAKRALESVTQEKLAKDSALQLVTAAGILHDKAALLRGQATGINVVALLDVVEAMRSLRGQPIPQTIDSASVPK